MKRVPVRDTKRSNFAELLISVALTNESVVGYTVNPLSLGTERLHHSCYQKPVTLIFLHHFQNPNIHFHGSLVVESPSLFVTWNESQVIQSVQIFSLGRSQITIRTSVTSALRSTRRRRGLSDQAGRKLGAFMWRECYLRPAGGNK